MSFLSATWISFIKIALQKIRILITTNGEHYQVHTCNVERTHTSKVEAIIYHSGPDGSVRIVHELDTYKN